MTDDPMSEALALELSQWQELGHRSLEMFPCEEAGISPKFAADQDGRQPVLVKEQAKSHDVRLRPAP